MCRFYFTVSFSLDGVFFMIFLRFACLSRIYLAATLPICHKHRKVCYPILFLELVTNTHMSHRYTHVVGCKCSNSFSILYNCWKLVFQGEIEKNRTWRLVSCEMLF